jgi:hypothetical protein
MFINGEYKLNKNEKRSFYIIISIKIEYFTKIK